MAEGEEQYDQGDAQAAETQDAGASNDFPIIIDTGSCFVRAGYAHQEKPSVFFRNVIGRFRKKHQEQMDPDGENPRYVGPDAVQGIASLRITSPMEQGHVDNWADMEEVWSAVLYQHLGLANVSTNPLLLLEHPNNPLKERVKTAQVFFEAHGVPELSLQVPHCLALMALGKTEGVVLECGDGAMSVVPIYDSTPLTHNVHRSDLGGRDVTDYLQSELGSLGNPFTKFEHGETLRGVKEAMCYVAEEPDVEGAKEDHEISMTHTVDYAFAWGNQVTLTHERWRAAELLFNPLGTIGRDIMGAATLLERAILDSPMDVRKGLASNIVLSGGCCDMAGFGKRVEIELSKVLNSQPRVVSKEGERADLSWQGACQASTELKAHQLNLWITREEWDEHGASILDIKNPLAKDR